MADPSRTASGGDGRDGVKRVGLPASAHQRLDMLHQRFREGEVALFEKHGAEIIAVWQRLDNPNTLVWMLAYRDRAHRDEVWAGFLADPAWTTLRQEYAVPIGADTFMMSATDYSALK